MKKKTGYGRLVKAASLVFAMAVLIGSSAALSPRVTAADTPAINAPEEYADRYVIKVSSFAELAAIAENVNGGVTDYKGITIALTKNISASSGSDSYKSGFSPIGTKEHPFRGIFDGCGYTVTLKLSKSSSYGPSNKNAVGLFGYAENAVIRNVTVSGSIESTEKAGGIAAYAISTEIMNCFNTASLKGATVGGIAAVISGTAGRPSVIGNCINKATSFLSSVAVSGYAGGFGGIVGRMEGEYSFVRNCYSSRSVTDAKIGGIAGYADGADPVMRVENSYYIAKSTAAHGICGTDDLTGFITAIDTKRASQSASTEGSLAFLMNRYIELQDLSETYGKWSYQTTSALLQIESKGKTELVTIGSAADWNNLAAASQKASLDGVYFLTADISGVTAMLGSTANPFRGALLGAGHSVTANITVSNTDNVGLISCSDKAAVRDVTVKGSIRGGYCTGGIVGKAVSTLIEDCVCAAKMYGTTDLGGIVGMAKGTTSILNCECVPVSAGSGFAQDGNNSWGGRLDTWGGIAAEISDDTVVRGCRFLSEIQSPGQIAGGIVGLMLGKSSVIACDSCGLVCAGTDNAGGIIGDADGGSLVEGCYSQSVVRANKVAGGIVGLASWSGGPRVRNCINVGLVASTEPGSFHTTAPFWVNSAYLYAIDLTKTDLNQNIGSGTTADLLVDYFNHEAENADYENPTYWKNGTDTAFEQVEVRPAGQYALDMLTAEPYVISTADDFRLFTVLVGFDGMKNSSWKLGANITLAASDYVTIPFAGTLDGDGHTLTIHFTNGSLFSEVSGTIKNLRVTGSVSGGGSIGAIAAKLTGGTLDSCENSALVNGSGNATGGLVGTVDGGTIRNCTNSAVVTGTGSGNVGGIFGLSRGAVSVSNCENAAIIRSHGSGVGGIGGGAESGSIRISSCENLSALIPDENGAFWLGGILGYAGAECEIEYCFNRATVYYRSKQTPGADMSQNIGGILGGASANVRVRVFGCGNFGEITDVADDPYWAWAWRIGGIVGDCSASDDFVIEFCVNDAHIYGMDDIGGIVGIMGSAFIDYCYNAGLAEQFNSARYRELALKIPSYWDMIREGTISGTSVSAFKGHVFTSPRNTEQLGGAEAANLWVHGLDDPAKTLEYLLNSKYINSTPFGWSIDSDGHCTKAEWSAINQSLVFDCSAENPYVISDMGTYRALQVIIASGHDFAGQYVRLDRDLTISSALIASGSAFRGVFDGNGKTITLDEKGDGRGVFGDIEGATVKNLKVTGIIKEGNLRGGFASTATATSFEYCESSVSIGTAFVGDDCGGFAGIMYNCVIIGCRSTATVYGANRIGGFVGSMYGGTVTDITGEASQSTGKGIVFGWENVGGFAGKTTDLTVQGAKLKPIVLGSSFVGGLIGDAYNCDISSCTVTTGTDNSKQWIYTTTASAGGLVGITCNSEMYDCKVFALVWSMGNAAGGIAGTCYPDTKIYRCTVEGGIYGYDRVGGVVGEAVNTEAGGLVSIDECTVATKNPAEPGGYVAITGRWSAGGIIGYTNAYTAVKYCTNSSAIWSDNADRAITPFVGGIVAYSASPSVTVMNCLNEGYLEAPNGVIGGIVAHASCAYLYNDVNTGTMRRAKYFGGIVCELGNTDVIKNCANVGEFVFTYSSTYVAYPLCPWSIDCWHCAVKDSSGGGGYWLGGLYLWGNYVPFAEMALFLNNGITDASPDSSDWIKWEHDGNTRLYPQKVSTSRLKGDGTESSPYLLSDTDDFKAFATLFNTGEVADNCYVRLANSFTTFNFFPIGTEQRPFKGDFDGAGYALTISIKDRPTRMNGVLGCTDGATVHDVTIRGDMVRVGSDSGMLVGVAKNTTITNCSCSGNFSTVADAARCGGIVGSARGSTKIMNCRSAGRVDQLGNQCGGIVGLACDSVQIIDCVSERNIELCCGNDCGGIVGIICGYGAKIIKCRNYGDIKVTSDGIGGICGLVDSTAGEIRNCRNYANITVDGDVTGAGGIVGTMHGYSMIKLCVNEGTVTIINGKGRFGGIVGNADYRNSYSGHREIQLVDCTNYGSVINSSRTANDIGGIAGYYSGTAVACVNNGNVEGGSAIGGIVGYSYYDSLSIYSPTREALYFCVNTGSVSANGTHGAYQYYGDSGDDIISDYYDVIGCVSGGNVTYGTLGALYAKTGVNPRGAAYRVPGIGADGLPTTVFRTGMGTESEPYIISDIRELEMLAWQTAIGNTDGGFEGEYFVLACDFDPDGQFIPIGLKTAFAGHFDGDGRTIELNALLKNSDYSARDHLALFANTAGATISNLRVSGSVDGAANEARSTASAYTAGIVGVAKNTTISDCQVDARVRGGNVVGGIVATAENTVLNNCICRSEVEGDHLVGGVVGEIVGDCSFLNCIGSAITRAADGTVGAFAGTMERAGSITWNGNFLVTGKTNVSKAIALGTSPIFAYLTPDELMTRSVLTPYYRTQETGICLTLFYVDHPHERADATYPAVAADYVRDGSTAYYRCNACGKYYTDAAHQHEIADFEAWKVIIPKFDKATTYEAGIKGGAIERFHTVKDFMQYLNENRTSEFRHISLGGDITTSFPVLVNSAGIYLHGHTWMTTGVYDAAIVEKGGSVIYGDGGTIASSGDSHSLISFSHLTVRDTTLRGASAPNGAALCDNKGAADALEIIGCRIYDCHASLMGGAVCMCGGSANLLVHVENSEIYDCSALEGGAICCITAKGISFRFVSGNIHHCSAAYGGGIYLSANDYVTINGGGTSVCRITDCRAKAMGGAICVSSETKAAVSGIEMIGNYTSDAYGPDKSNPICSDESIPDACDGGALFIDAPEANVTGTNFAMNSAGHRGGAISCGNGTKTLAVTDCRFYLDVIPNEPGYSIGYGYEVYMPTGAIGLKNVIVHPVLHQEERWYGYYWFYTASGSYSSTDYSGELHINTGVAGASTFDDATLGIVIGTASVGLAALAGVAAFVIIRKKKKKKAA